MKELIELKNRGRSMSRNLYIQVITCRKYIRVDIFVLLLLISSFSSLLAYDVFLLIFVTFLFVTTSLFEGEIFVCNTLNRCVYTLLPFISSDCATN